MRLTIPTYYDFSGADGAVGSSLLSRESWDALRASPMRDFAIPEHREDWLALFAGRDDLREAAKAIVAVCRDLRLEAIFSLGVGGAALEYFIKEAAPDLYLTCADYAPATVERVSRVFEECDQVTTFDLRQGDWRARPGCLCLLHRVDTELTDQEWWSCFEEMAVARVQPVLVAASGFVDWKKTVKAALVGARRGLGMRAPTFAGYARTRDAFARLWGRSYEVERQLRVGDRAGYLLVLKEPPLEGSLVGVGDPE